ncbi:MAG TPA: amidase [Roseiflexaceae bacterium]|nr:amidase [Roseiflexaceae bacterium]
MNELTFTTATDLAEMIRTRQVSAIEVLEAQLAHIAAHNPALNAVVTLDEAGARERARSADAALAKGEEWGPLHGVPMTLKDAHAVAGMRTTCGFPPLADYVPPEDGSAAARLKAAGAIIMGKTNVPTLLADAQTDNPIFGRTNNPWDLARTPGGSSGGACAAVAAGMTPLEVGTDLSGSIRMPAHCCGVYGLKPTEHRVSLEGIVAGPPNGPRPVRIMSTVGPIARSLDDLALGLQVLAGPDRRDTEVPPVALVPHDTPSLRNLRVAWAPTFPSIPVANDIRAAIERLASELEGRGSRVEACLPNVDFGAQGELFNDLLGLIMGAFQPAEEANEPITLAAYFAALARRDGFIRQWEDFFDDWDVLICPTAMTPAFAHCPQGAPIDLDGAQVDYWNFFGHSFPFNLTGHPALVMPCGQDRVGLPIGVQLVGQLWSEEKLLAIARAVEPLTGGFQRPRGY